MTRPEKLLIVQKMLRIQTLEKEIGDKARDEWMEMSVLRAKKMQVTHLVWKLHPKMSHFKKAGFYSIVQYALGSRPFL